jgi:hypothetical protein
MAASRPETIDQYVAWASATLGVDFTAAATRIRYETNIQNAQNAVQNSRFMQYLPEFVAKQEQEYHKDTGAGLLMSSELRVLTKPFGSAVTKSYRRNVLRNNRFPDPPTDGWISPDSWYSRFDDLVRSTFVCKFLDGPIVLAPALDAYAISTGFSGRHVARNTDDGYYAFHQYTTFPIDVVDAAWQTQTTMMELEIQLTTQLQEVLRGLTHPLYESARVASNRRDERWKWDHDTPRFRTSYLGHTLHMIEAVIVQVRDSARIVPANTTKAATLESPKQHTDSSAEMEAKE